MFDRQREWAALTQFVTDQQPGATLGVVSGRRRQGKTFLIDALCRATGGFYFGATEGTQTETLRRLGSELATHLGSPAPLRLPSWHDAVDALLALGESGPVPVILDEFPYLVRASPELPSIIQNAYGPLRDERRQSKTRLLLCGSAFSFMGSILSGNAPLRGRAGLELVVHTLDFQNAAQFWELSDHQLAVKVNAILGGTPAYRREFARNDTPAGPEDFDDWVIRTVLNPESPLFREARYLLAEEPGIRDTALYHSVLAAIANGSTTRGAIANYLGRKASDLAHALDVLEDSRLLLRDSDAFRHNRSTYRIAEPLITFYHAIMRPAWSILERPDGAERIWRSSAQRFSSAVVGPRFEQICRDWILTRPVADDLHGLPVMASRGHVADPAQHIQHEVDVVVLGAADNEPTPVLAIGEAKWGNVLDASHVDRLRHIRTLLERRGKYDISRTRLFCFGAAGFTRGIRDAADSSSDVRLVSLADLYARD
jgi:hypothetical protein